MTKPNDPVFGATTIPKEIEIKDEMKVFGLTKREYFAAMIYQGINTVADTIQNRKVSAYVAVECADALIKELNKNA